MTRPSELTQTLSFKAGVYQSAEAVDPQTGAVDLTKIYLFATPSAEVQALDLTATLTAEIQGDSYFVGVLTAHFGAVAAGQKVIYAGVSCDAAPTKMFAPPPAKLVSRVVALYRAATPGQSSPVELYPSPPMTSYPISDDLYETSGSKSDDPYDDLRPEASDECYRS